MTRSHMHNALVGRFFLFVCYSFSKMPHLELSDPNLMERTIRHMDDG